MKSHARVVVIGGGVVGCSVLYHLTKLGWSDVLLIERKELTAGSSWHAAGGFHAINGDISIARLQAYTISLYREIEAASGQDVGLRMTGGLNIAATGERWDSLKAEWARHRVMGIDSELVGPEEVKRLCPIIDTTGILGAIYDRNEGHLDPSGATHAYAKAARLKGAEIARQTRVMELMRTPAGLWRVMTDQGTVEAEHVVNAAGLWAREVGAMAGARLPLIPIEHHYLITADIPELAALPQLIPVCADLDGGIYVRQEGKGALLGVYEPDPRPWAEDGTPWDYGDTELLPPNLDRLSDTLAHGLARFPPVAIAGIKRVVNGPFTFTPDGNPLVGPIAGIPNYWCACGVMAGFAQGGGVGLSLAEWIVSGEPQADIFGMDVARFGEFATPGYTREKSREFYSRRFQIAYPNEFWPAMRPLKTTPVHDMLGARNAVFGVSYGLEVPLYFAASKDTAHEVPSLRRSNAFPIVAEECAAARSAVVALDASSFAKYEVAGRGAEAWLDWLLPVRMPEPGRIRLAPMLGDGGRLMGDLTVMRLAADRFLVFGSGYLQAWHMRWFRERLPDRAVAVANLTEQLGGFAISGPHARTLLGGLTGADVSDDAIRFFSVRRMEVGPIDAIVARLSITGELGYEIYVP
ncbi:MAG TPA: FAD-dependent oxidoreductase, partial [Stellaceae bacterium]|nr:FAD-dependent oxidoreductase [Stellaceae bacterium]